MWREAARVLPRAAAAWFVWPSPRPLYAGGAGFYAGRAPRCGARRYLCCLERRQLCRHRARSTRAALASTLARATVWREAARVLPRAASACRFHRTHGLST
eukprot:scaffold106209_cov55-Phaeocystis_antarctica.AAC.1